MATRSLAEQYDADSIDVIEIASAVERRFDILIEDHEVYDLSSVGEFVDLVDAKVAAKHLMADPALAAGASSPRRPSRLRTPERPHSPRLAGIRGPRCAVGAAKPSTWPAPPGPRPTPAWPGRAMAVAAAHRGGGHVHRHVGPVPLPADVPYSHLAGIAAPPDEGVPRPTSGPHLPGLLVRVARPGRAVPLPGHPRLAVAPGAHPHPRLRRAGGQGAVRELDDRRRVHVLPSCSPWSSGASARPPPSSRPPHANGCGCS